MDYKTFLARDLRKNATKQEKVVWSILRNSNLKHYKFKRQVPIGTYIVDFVCNERMLIIEIDGGQHNQDADKEYDNQRTKYLESKGYKVIRFWNSEVDKNIGGVYETILKHL